uniref:Complex III subunit 9 n=1 Tax=Suricata suricatta TaxID=37032 RepID=A0A673U4C6_SURSU
MFTVMSYPLLFQRTSTFALTIAMGALFLQQPQTKVCVLSTNIKEGKLWKHIKHESENNE